LQIGELRSLIDFGVAQPKTHHGDTEARSNTEKELAANEREGERINANWFGKSMSKIRSRRKAENT